jgi:DNA mismatch endonuclease (patch repair protein)
MVGNRSRDTVPELRVRSLVHRSGLRYRVSSRPLPEVRRTADMVFRSARVAVFIDGCFWHGCPTHGTKPKTNREYWLPKIQANKRRDKEFDQVLKEAGWLVIRAWEHDDPKLVAGKVIRTVGRRVSSTA